LVSAAATKAVQELLSLQESDLIDDCWERPTRTLLEPAAQASRVPLRCVNDGEARNGT